MTKREYLEQYSELVREVYAPRAYFERSVPALLALRAKWPPRSLWRDGSRLFVVLLAEAFHLGIRAKNLRFWFWKAFLQLLWKNPQALEAFAFDVSVFYHLQRHVHYVQSEISRYLLSPSEDDVLDQVIVPELLAAAANSSR